MRFVSGSFDQISVVDAFLYLLSKQQETFLGNPVVRTSLTDAGGIGLIPGWGAQIPHALWPKNQDIKQSNIVTNSVKSLKNGAHPKTASKSSVPFSVFFLC